MLERFATSIIKSQLFYKADRLGNKDHTTNHFQLFVDSLFCTELAWIFISFSLLPGMLDAWPGIRNCEGPWEHLLLILPCCLSVLCVALCIHRVCSTNKVNIDNGIDFLCPAVTKVKILKSHNNSVNKYWHDLTELPHLHKKKKNSKCVISIFKYIMSKDNYKELNIKKIQSPPWIFSNFSFKYSWIWCNL